MIRSMTGYGASEYECDQWQIQVEVRSVNHDQLKVSPRLPDMLRLKESELNRLLREFIQRGHVYVKVNADISEQAMSMLVDKRKLRAYVRLARELSEEADVPLRLEVGSMLALPGIQNTETLPREVRDAMWEDVLDATRNAIKSLVEMRTTEGEKLSDQLSQLSQELQQETEAVKSRIDECLEKYQEKLVERVDQLLNGIDARPEEGILAREIAATAERGDISEEVARMESHLEQFDTALQNDENAVGKKLEFLVQEMLRETNTMASKIPCSELVEIAVEMKTNVNRLREQVRNIE
ncbi:MAG: YicC family protein [Planctomycetes bacterium]|nr:YicC family protein [Planctomycetota bacterium]